MELFLEILTVLGLVLLGFLVAEFQNAYLDKQGKGGIIYFSFIGVTFTQKDAQRLFFAIFLGVGIMFLLPILIKLTGYDVNGYLVYIITGYAPSTVVLIFKKKFKSKVGIDLDIKSSTGGNPNPDHEEH